MDFKKYSNLIHIHTLLETNQVDEANSQLKGLEMSSSDKIYNIATFVWLAKRVPAMRGEQTAVSEELVACLVSQWQDKASNVFEEQPDIYTSNLAMIYTALKEVKQIENKTILQKTMTEIRDYIFANLLKERSLIQSKTNRTQAPEELLSVMPYGLFAPEDLIVVDAMEKIQELFKNEAYLEANKQNLSSYYAIFGLYLCEKFDIKGATSFLTKAREALQTELSQPLVKLLAINLAKKTKLAKDIQILHEPFGFGDVYLELPTERLPHYPLEGEATTFGIQVISNKRIEGCELLIGKDSYPLKETEASGFWQVTLPDVTQYSKGYYHFLVKAEDKTLEKSADYLLENKTEIVPTSLAFVGITNLGNCYVLHADDRHLGYLVGCENSLVFKHEIADLTESKKADTTKLFLVKNSNTITLNKHNQLLSTWSSISSMISFNLINDDKYLNINFKMNTPENTKYYGFGERYNAIDQKGETIDCFVYNQYRDQGTKTYMPMPYFITNQQFGMHVNTLNYTKFELESKQTGVVEITVDLTNEESIEFIFLLGNKKEMIRQFMQNSGSPKMLPKWALGPWMSSNNWDRDSIVRKEIQKTNELNIPATVIVLEQWSDETTYYMFNDAEYELKNPAQAHKYEEMVFPEWGRWPDPKGLVEHCHDNGLKFILWQIPIMKYLNQQTHPLKDSDEKYMIEKGYEVKNEDLTPYRIPHNWFTDSMIMDFSNEEGKKWWFDKRQYLLDIGVDGFKTDGGEMVYGKDLVFSDGLTGDQMRNKYPNDYVQSYYDFAQENDGITFSRAGYTGAQSFPAHWAGDERSTFGAFKRSLTAGLNAGMSGIIFWGWDLGGFNGEIPTAELFMRSTAMATFCPIMQYHAESKAEFNQDRTPWNIADRRNSKETIDVYRFYANVRMNLLPYIYSESLHACQNKEPLMSALTLTFEQDDNVATLYDEYLFGRSLLVAPVIEEGAVSRNVYFPEGKWMNIWTKEIIQGSQEKVVTAQIDEIPVYQRENTAIVVNVGEDFALGSSVGNEIEKYCQMKIIVFATKSFETLVFDHLNQEIRIKVTVQDGQIDVKVSGTDEKYLIDIVKE